MSQFRFVPAAAVLAGLVLLATPTAGAAAKPRSVTHRTQPHHHHLTHLQQALKHLQSAHHHAKGNSGSATGQLNAAIQQLELARSHHLAQTKQTQMNGGLAGGLTKAAHHHHHSHITQAIHDAKAAEKQVSAGHHQKALHDIGKAQHQTQLAIASHHHLIGR